MPGQPLTLQSLPLFPLEAALFPGGLLNLRVFEARYQDMVRKCHAAGAPFGAVALRPDRQARQAGAVQDLLYPVGTIAAIDALRQPQAGLLLMVCRAAHRFRIQNARRLPHGLWLADVQGIAPDAALSIPTHLQHTAQALQRLLARLQTASPPSPRVPQPWQLTDCGWVANRWCELLPLPLHLKQQLLELESPQVRLELVSDFLHHSGIDR